MIVCRNPKYFHLVPFCDLRGLWLTHTAKSRDIAIKIAKIIRHYIKNIEKICAKYNALLPKI
ncbi:hypothetical protein BKN38_01465 [Helicobacter sp. CLO-3]|nr:hypothetical protein BKN38_01465 [Helicobacter sp. CLO-3]